MHSPGVALLGLLAIIRSLTTYFGNERAWGLLIAANRISRCALSNESHQEGARGVVSLVLVSLASGHRSSPDPPS